MSVPASLRCGPFTPSVLVKKRYIIFYIALIWVSFFAALLELWVYWQFLYDWKPIHFWIFIPLVFFLMYVTAVLVSIVFARFLLIMVNIFHKPRTGIFLRNPSDRDYRYWSISNTIKRWPIWLSHKFPFPFLDNICFKMFGVKTTFSNSLFEGWIDTEFIDIGKKVVIGQASIIQSAIIMGNFLIIKKTIIDDHVKVGAHCVVMPGTHIGEKSILGAGSFTTVDQKLESGWIYIGTPAKKYKRNRFFEDNLEEKLESLQVVDVDELRMKYEEIFFMRDDKHVSLRERLKKQKEIFKDEKRRLKEG